MTGSEQWRLPADNAGRAERIRLLNDQFRSSFQGGKIVMTQGVIDHAGSEVPGLITEVRQFSSFDGENDPYGEHDFGGFEWADETVFWKIEYYDSDMLMGSPDPTDNAVTIRVLTIMLAREY